jgi:cytochrome P450
MSVSIAQLDLPYLDLEDPAILADPFAAARALAEDHWIARLPGDNYILLQYKECNEVSRDRRYRIPAALGLDKQGVTEGIAFEWGSESLLGLDGPEHGRLRGLANRSFSRRRSEELIRPFARATIRELMDTFEAPGHGEIATLTNPYAIRNLCHMLGFPDKDWELLNHWAESIVNIISLDIQTILPEIEQSIRELDAYTLDQIEALRKSPDDSLGSELIQAEEAGDRLTSHELVRLFESLLMAGAHTIQNQIALGILQFIKHPDQWRDLGADPALADSAVEEVLRYRAPFLGSIRTAREDVEIREGIIAPAGAKLTIGLAFANFDSRLFPEPEQFDQLRYNDRSHAATAHQSFGNGPHVCIGAHLARVELSEAFSYMAQRMPNLRIDEADPTGVQWTLPFGIHGPTHLPLRWDSP